MQGQVEIEYPGEAHQKTYEVTMLFCKLRAGTQAGEGGHLTVLIDKEELIVYGEPRGNSLRLQVGWGSWWAGSRSHAASNEYWPLTARQPVRSPCHIVQSSYSLHAPNVTELEQGAAAEQ